MSFFRQFSSNIKILVNGLLESPAPTREEVQPVVKKKPFAFTPASGPRIGNPELTDRLNIVLLGLQSSFADQN